MSGFRAVLGRWLLPVHIAAAVFGSTAGNSATAQISASAAAQAGHASSPAPSAPVRVTASVAPKDVTIGTPFRYTIRVESRPDVEVAMPLLADRLGEYAIVDFGHVEPVTEADGTRVVEHWYDLVAYATGSQYVPAVPLAYKAANEEAARAETPRVVVNVESLITKAGGADDIPGMREAVAIVAPRFAPSLMLAGAALAAGLGWIAVRWWRKRRAGAAVPVRAAHVIALEALAELRKQRLVENGQHERYYVTLTDIVRRYVEARFGLHAPEMTTDEFLAATQRSRDLLSAHRSALQEFLVEADLVKFARHVPTRERAERAWSAAEEFISATKPQEVERAAA